MPTNTARLMRALWIPIFLCAAINPALATKKEVDINTQPVKQDGKYISFGHISGNSEHVVLLVEDARIQISRGGSGSEITVSSNCPHNWNLSGSTIRQAGFVKPRAGVSMSGDALGSRAIVNGRIYQLPTGPVKGLSLNKDGVTVGGQKIEPIQGADVPGTCDDDFDLVQVKVPDTYSGSLLLGCSGASDAVIEGWNGGKLECTLLRNSKLTASGLKSLEKAVLDLRGAGTAQIDGLTAKVLVVNVEGTGSLAVKNGAAQITNATATGGGSITLKGKFNNLQKDVKGQGTIEVTP